MKNVFAYLFILTLVASCDAPQSTRLVPGASNALTNPVPTTTGGFSGVTTAGTGLGVVTGGSTSGSSTTPGFQNCDITPKYYAPGLGYLGLCQSSIDETQIALKPTVTDTSSRTCLIPTFKDVDGSSAYIGQPQCTYTTQNTVVIGQLAKSRSGFSTYSLNGVMVMKETALTAYFQCMDAYTSYVSQACPMGAKTNANCDAYARNWMADLCNTFKTSNSYLDVRLK
jgi:hypothetical protein